MPTVLWFISIFLHCWLSPAWLDVVITFCNTTPDRSSKPSLRREEIVSSEFWYLIISSAVFSNLHVTTGSFKAATYYFSNSQVCSQLTSFAIQVKLVTFSYHIYLRPPKVLLCWEQSTVLHTSMGNDIKLMLVFSCRESFLPS